MHRLLIVCVFISLSKAATILGENQAKLLSYENNQNGQGNYKFSFETSNGIERQETGRLVNIGQPNEHVAVQGFYSYTDPEGKKIIVNYFADENGYHTEEEQMLLEILPQAPPIAIGAPPALVASLLG